MMLPSWPAFSVTPVSRRAALGVFSLDSRVLDAFGLWDSLFSVFSLAFLALWRFVLSLRRCPAALPDSRYTRHYLFIYSCLHGQEKTT